MTRKTSVLDLVEPEPIEVPVRLRASDGKEAANVLRLRSFTLKDERWMYEEFGDEDVVKTMLAENDVRSMLKIFCHQLEEESQSVLCKLFQCDAEELAGKFYSDVHLDSMADSNQAQALLEAVMLARSKSFPDSLPEPKGEDAKKKFLRWLLRTMRWSLLFWLGLAAAQLEWMPSAIGALEGFLLLIESSLS